jgi:hypothetical protein
MSGGGIINDRATALLHTVHKSCFYGSLIPADKATIDALEKKRKSAPTSLDDADGDTVLQVLGNTLHS